MHIVYRDYPLVMLYRPGLGLLVLLAVIWTLVWKGIALWKAGQNGHKGWFVALFLLNTLGILEIVYIVWFGQKKPAY